MTDTNKGKDKPLSQQSRSFKEQILADLEEAVRQRRQREAEEFNQIRLQKEASKRQAELERQKIAERQKQKEDVIAAVVRAQAEQLARQDAEAKVTRQALQRLNEGNSGHSTYSLTPDDGKNIDPASTEDSASSLVDIESLVKPELVAKPKESENDLSMTQRFALDSLIQEQESVEEEVPQVSEGDAAETAVTKSSHIRRKRQQNNQVARRISLAVVGVLVSIILITGVVGVTYIRSALGPVEANSTEYVQVEIPNGSGNKLIGQILEEAGAIKNATVFNYYTKFKNYSNFQSGYYNVKKSMTLDEIAQLLQEGGTAEPVTPSLGKILIPEGYTIEQIAKAVAVNADSKKGEASPYKAEDFLTLIKDEAFIEKMVAKYPTLLGSLPDASSVTYRLEGYLFPATYSYYEGTTLEDIVDQMLAAMDSNLAAYYNQIAANGMTVNEVLTIASLVEKEGSTDDDRKTIASVFYNRLAIGMPLQSNIAILYAMGILGQETTLKQDTTVDTGIDSPYNVYVNTGLMPSPVDSPSLSAIEATVNPSDTDYLYFVADVTTGAVYYTADYDEHLANVETYVNSKVTD